MAEDNDRQARLLLGDEIVDGADIGDDLGAAIRVGELAGRRVGRLGRAVAAMVVGVDMEAAPGEEIGEAGIARGVFGQPVIDLDDRAWAAFGAFHIEVELGAGRGRNHALLAE